MLCRLAPPAATRPAISSAQVVHGLERVLGHELMNIQLAGASKSSSPLYQSSFKPNWICRDVVDVAVITPAVGAGVVEADENTTVFGVPKLA